MAIDNMALLINRIYEKTKTGSVEWTEEASGAYSLKLRNNKISIAQYHDADSDPEYSDPDYIVSIFDRNGVWIESIGDMEISEALPNAFKLMQSIYRDARRSARGFNDVVNELLNELDDEL